MIDDQITDPVLVLLAKYRAGMEQFNASPEDDDDDKIAAATWLPHYEAMTEAPVAQTLAGAVAALEFALEEYRDSTFADEAVGMVRSALGFLQKFEAPPPRQATRTELEAYREWLHLEGNVLGHELYGELGDHAHRYIPANTGVDDLHIPAGGASISWEDMPQPSTRAVAVLTAVGANFEKINRWHEEFQVELNAARCMEAAKSLIAAQEAGEL